MTQYTVEFHSSLDLLGFWCFVGGGLALAFLGACFLVYRYLPGILFCLFYYLVIVPVTLFDDLRSGVPLKKMLKYDLTPRKGGRRS